jgi:phosphoribosylformimino-5-aminoimidazole carboxamide ribonucleotide (ProFAR) isomerase
MRVRVGGGIRTSAKAKRILDGGAEKIIVGSAAFRRGRVNSVFLSRLARKVGRERVIVAVDTEGGHIVVRGWQEKLRLRPDDVFPELARYGSEFLCTYVDAEGTMRGTSLAWFRALRAATDLPITAAGGIRSHREVRALEKLGMNAAVGMALYLNRLR